MSIILPRRAILAGLIAAPAVIAAERLMRLPRPEIIKPSDPRGHYYNAANPAKPFVSGQSTINGLPIYHADGRPMMGGDLAPGTVFTIGFGGDRWVMS
jgi:hypothetical protein